MMKNERVKYIGNSYLMKEHGGTFSIVVRGSIKYKIEEDTSVGNYLVYRLSFFGFRKECVARMNDLESAHTLVNFLQNPTFYYKQLGFNETTRGYIKDEVNFIVKNILEI